MKPPVDLVLWPEDVVDVSRPVRETAEGRQLAELARRLHATLVAGVVEDAGARHFRNAAVAWGPRGRIVARYDKVHRVPFGEYIPFKQRVPWLYNILISLGPPDMEGYQLRAGDPSHLIGHGGAHRSA